MLEPGKLYSKDSPLSDRDQQVPVVMRRWLVMRRSARRGVR
jgi:hypothetical protein